jgi:hypothetical protein
MEMKGAIWMSSEPIFFQFGEDDDTNLALDTLEELGYQAGVFDYQGKATLHLHLDNQDIASALQIVQSYGGNLVEVSRGEEIKLYDEAYSMDTISIPAHLVNEDWEEQDAVRAANTLAADDAISGFDAGIHM